MKKPKSWNHLKTEFSKQGGKNVKSFKADFMMVQRYSSGRKGKNVLCVWHERHVMIISQSGAQCNYSYHREAVAVKKTANKNVFTWKIKCNFKVHDCYVRGWCVVFDKQ
jgi:hypothetical protein